MWFVHSKTQLSGHSNLWGMNRRSEDGLSLSGGGGRWGYISGGGGGVVILVEEEGGGVILVEEEGVWLY